MSYEQLMEIINSLEDPSCVLSIMFGSGYKFIYGGSGREHFDINKNIDKDKGCVTSHITDLKDKPVTVYGAITDITHVFTADDPSQGVINVGSILR